MRNVILFMMASVLSTGVFAIGVLGTPNKGSTVSGVGVISGYHCNSKDITVYIDGNSIGKAGAGTTLLGTLGTCGQTETGYSLVYNFNNLAPGQHTISVTADGVTFDSGTFYTVQSGGVPWLAGVAAEATLDNFPTAGKRATLVWYQSYQNFVITKIEDMAGGTLPPPPPSTGGNTITLIPGVTASFTYDEFYGSCQVTMTATNNTGQYISGAAVLFNVMVNGINTGPIIFLFTNVPNGQTASSQTLVDRQCGSFSLIFDEVNSYLY